MPDDDQFQRKKQKFLTKKYEPYVEYAKKLLFEKVNSVVISNRLTNEPCVVVADTYGHSSFMDKIQKAQMFSGANDDNPLSDFKKIMEINPHHKVNQILLEKIVVRLSLSRITKPMKKQKNQSSYFTKLPLFIQVSVQKIPTILLNDSIELTRKHWE